MKTIILNNIDMAQELFGRHNDNISKIADTTETKIDVRGNELHLRGKETDVLVAENIIHQLYELVKKRYSLNPTDIESAAKALRLDSTCKLATIFLDTIFTTVKNRPITPRNPAQKRYVDAARKNDIVFSIGPAGTGKTYLAMAMAVAAFTRGEINRIVLTRPAVEAGETLGFLPGDLAEKINPYLRPLYDALYDMLAFDRARELIEQGTIEIAPLAFMRGRTLNNSFIILDEAQNTSSEQMKMFLTRIGYSSRAVITGDITQIDLPRGKKSGLVEAKNILQGIEGLEFVYFTREDVVRHRLVSRIIQAYERSTKTGKNLKK
ncbi:PhoH1 [Desulforapulum autotrophicum HRM2]|uniref:PhoH-like protein n=1 Tax=Desulforapulum autotrophicum (strain ATCC 43914 / DSM 3382 / VKM B-1955 / HRM2) TaxID=177437 RepID=C0Q9D7_DESAH|nr:PhoH family protein [Desulforapulum autotrophicum]ACN16642.1 PhoH1 [Desulforapulum autotrophicum HRM2]